MNQRCAIAIMAKAPAAGRSKTRLCPPLSAAQAADASAAFLSDMAATLRKAALHAPIDSFVAFAPAGEQASLATLAPGLRLMLADGSTGVAQGVEGFGRVLLQALNQLLDQGYTAACVLNADSPDLPCDLLVRAAHTLLRPGDRAVMGPAEDGGYYLLGLKHPHIALLADIPWSTADVAERTRAQCAAIDLSLDELAMWYDVDDRAALTRLERSIASGADAPHTASLLRQLASLGVLEPS